MTVEGNFQVKKLRLRLYRIKTFQELKSSKMDHPQKSEGLKAKHHRGRLHLSKNHTTNIDEWLKMSC